MADGTVLRFYYHLVNEMWLSVGNQKVLRSKGPVCIHVKILEIIKVLVSHESCVTVGYNGLNMVNKAYWSRAQHISARDSRVVCLDQTAHETADGHVTANVGGQSRRCSRIPKLYTAIYTIIHTPSQEVQNRDIVSLSSISAVSAELRNTRNTHRRCREWNVPEEKPLRQTRRQ